MFITNNVKKEETYPNKALFSINDAKNYLDMKTEGSRIGLWPTKV